MSLLKEKWLVLTLVLIALFLPFMVTNSYHLHLIIMGYIWAIAAYGLNLILGYCGQVSLGHAGFIGIGAYTAGLLILKSGLSFWPSLLLACLFTAFIGWLAGIVSLRTRGHSFAIFTLCVGVIIHVIITRWDNFTGGMNGLIGINGPNPIPFPFIGQITFDTLQSQYYLILLFLLATIFVVSRIVNSLIGRTLSAIKSSEELAEVLGINVMKNKIFAFVLATLFAGLSGSLYAGYIKFLGPQICDVSMTFDILLYLFVGGNGSLAGPLIGSLALSSLTEGLQVVQQYRMIIFGPILILIMIFFPRGINGGIEVLRTRYRQRALTGSKANQVNKEVS